MKPRPDGLPASRVVAIPLAALALLFVALVALGITGSSTGAVHSLISDGHDQDLIAGHPQGIRSDEWFVQTSWTISQVEQGLPLRNESFPGGMDATVQHDLPAADWSLVLRPHLLGFLFLPLDQAMAFKWWFPGFAAIAAGYLLVIALLPRRPVSAVALSVAFFFSPFLQWWYLSATLYSAAWAFLVMAAVIWCLKSAGNIGRWVLAALLAYLTAALGTGTYAPFIIPVVVVALAFSVGSVIARDFRPGGFGARVRSIVPVLVAGAVSAIVLGVWLITRWSTIASFTSTVYPGERLQQVGYGGAGQLGGLFSGVLSIGLEYPEARPFDSNSSEAATFLLPGVFLSVVLIWLVVTRLRSGGGVDWLSVSLLGVEVLLLAYLFIPGWDWLAHLTFLDRSTYGRLRIGFGVLSFAIVVVAGMRLDERRRRGEGRAPAWIPILAAGLAVASVAVVFGLASRIIELSTAIDALSRARLIAGAGIIVLFVGCVWLFARGRFALAATALLIASIASSAWVNPIYRGVLDLRETAAVAEIETLDAERPGAWVALNTTVLPTMMLVESGVSTLSGFQSSPSTEMWEEIDPSGDHEAMWNRLANVYWVPEEGVPTLSNPAPDQIRVTFDSCDAFAQENVAWVLAEGPVGQDCLSLVSTVEQGPSTMYFYEVTPTP